MFFVAASADVSAIGQPPPSLLTVNLLEDQLYQTTLILTDILNTQSSVLTSDNKNIQVLNKKCML